MARRASNGTTDTVRRPTSVYVTPAHQDDRPTTCKIFGAILARLLFACHNIVSVWHVTHVTKDDSYWLFVAVPLTLFLEGLVTIGQRDGDEYKWFCPSVFICLCGSVPPIWFMEIKQTLDAMRDRDDNFTTHVEDSYMRIGDSTVEIPIHLPGEVMMQMAEQTLLVVLVVGRWILPKGEITRDELSQLLLAYLAISSDIVELFNVFKLVTVRLSLQLTLIVLSLWSISLIQFPLIITTAKGQKARYCWSPSSAANDSHARLATPRSSLGGNPGSSMYLHVSDSNLGVKTSPISVRNRKSGSLIPQGPHWIEAEPDTIPNTCCRSFRSTIKNTAIWGIILTVLLQDGPFFALRLYLIFWKGVFDYTMGFFVCKNALIIAVQIYRVLVICTESQNGSLESNWSEMDFGPLTASTSIHSTPATQGKRKKSARKSSLIELAAEAAAKNAANKSARYSIVSAPITSERKITLGPNYQTCGSLNAYEKEALEFGIGQEKDPFEDLAYL